ncbi:ABC transporter ATP-binding protein [Aerococcus sp. UMB8608]|uniref:ABC transporter ATP-binding protein n=1 Tax=Aerococcus sanguinicola TaxID=119206 RepID=A0A5N1GPU8_9LACT|nr:MULTISPECIES: ABC transporter ATP-binding protein [Aerococcus]KAA9302248.1 ABC transporter ATP-binding protein [Aerococcus sanguinicola]MDK6369000.1 ABC transporter ATP-binding protein [Aerococcus sp. UMB9870]MDK6678902.1 ABC transporter ATP-binding protein [Aerococcus sp. UMB8608]MDK6686779.1 ABC transporter ATP-binding protein [Aerococcus sp. UMB8623]MDK6939561.1 ABC transporter ATP-binding protein [Aerococcus sp. UMB8487]
MAYIEFKDVVKSYGEGRSQVLANDHMNFEIEAGEFVVILGPSGAGKSTTLNILGGMDKPTSGEIWVDGQEIGQFNDRQLTKFRRDNVGFVFQFYNLIPNLTARENIELSEQIAQQAIAADQALAAVSLTDRQNNFPAQLSGGEQQRVSIARALAKNPKLLLCDEPTGALDNETGQQVLALLQKQSREQDTTVIVITHNRAIAPMADRVIEIKNGQVADSYLQAEPKTVSEIEW